MAEISLKSLATLQPDELISARLEALRQRRYAFIYHSYHPQSRFRQQFTSCQDYVRFAGETLTEQLEMSWRSLAFQKQGERAEILLLLTLHRNGSREEYVELAEFEKLEQGWRYLHSYRVLRDELPVDENDICCQRIRQLGFCF